MKSIQVMILFATISMSSNFALANNGKFSEDCDQMRKVVSSLTLNLTTMNNVAIKMAIQLEAKGVTPEVETYDAAIRVVADTIDGLAYKIDQSCK